MTSPQNSMDPVETLARHAALSARIHRDRAPLERTVYPLGLVGVLTLLSAIVAAFCSPSVYGVYWAFAGPLGGVSIGIHYARLEHRLSIRRMDAWPAALTALTLVVGASLLGAATQAATAPFVAVAAGLTVFGLLWRNPPTLLAAALTAITAGVVAAASPSSPETWMGALVGVVLLGAAGLDHRSGSRA